MPARSRFIIWTISGSATSTRGGLRFAWTQFGTWRGLPQAAIFACSTSTLSCLLWILTRDLTRFYQTRTIPAGLDWRERVLVRRQWVPSSVVVRDLTAKPFFTGSNPTMGKRLCNERLVWDNNCVFLHNKHQPIHHNKCALTFHVKLYVLTLLLSALLTNAINLFDPSKVLRKNHSQLKVVLFCYNLNWYPWI